MSLKDKLRSLIEATFTSKKAFIAQQSTVNYNEQSTSSVTSGQTFVSTINGYARLHAVTNGANGELSVDFGVSDRLVTVQARQSGNWVDFLFPVAKGNTYRIQGSDLESATVTLFSLIGGGILALLSSLFAEVAYVF